jgi:hypothetical protein
MTSLLITGADVKRLTFGMMVLAATVLAGMAEAEQDKAEPPLRLELNLVDGSRIIGAPSIEAIPVETSYAKMNVPLRQIRTMKIGADHETVSFDLQNGDQLKGVMSLPPLKLTTVFGEVAIDVSLVAGISVYPGGTGTFPAILKECLVLYCSFDTDEGEKVTDASGKGHDGKVVGATWTPKGKAGGAYRFWRSKNSRMDFPFQPSSGDQSFSIVLWFNMSEHPQNNEYAMIAWGSQSRGKLAEAGLRWEDNTFQFHYAGDNSPRTADRKDDGQWHFGTITYDGRTAKVYIDSQLADSREEILNIGPGTTSVGYRKAYGDCYYDGLLDEVRVYSRALTADEIRLLYDAEK